MSNSKEFFLLLAAIVIFFVIKNESAIEVQISQGRLKGVILESRNGTKFYGFRGIPYAKPPVGDLRLEPPQPPDSWDGIRDASKLPPICIQKSFFSPDLLTALILGQEDCLYLNVYMPLIDKKNGELLPVMAFIHGGAFIEGSANLYLPDFIMDNKVVFVTMNYRVAALGFLSAVDEVLPGNYGLKDQSAALRWVQENIVPFGGDPKRVTIFGESAGGASVHYHLYSPLSKGLFHQAIIQSGTALANWAQASPAVARKRTEAFALLVGCQTKNTRIMLNCLKKIPAEDFIYTHNKFYVWDFHPMVPFAPVVEPKSVTNAFLTENPWHQKIVNDVPLVIGFTSSEGAIFSIRYLLGNNPQIKTIDENYERILPLIFSFGAWMDLEEQAKVSYAIKTYYFKERPISEETVSEFVDMISDGYFTATSIEVAMRHTNKLFMYCYDHRNKNNFVNIFGNSSVDLGVSHADDLLSLFPMQVFTEKLKLISSTDIEVSKRMISYWINFAYNGNPGWQSTTAENLQYLRIMTEKDEMQQNAFKDRYLFWKNLDIDLKHREVDVINMKDEL